MRIVLSRWGVVLGLLGGLAVAGCGGEGPAPGGDGGAPADARPTADAAEVDSGAREDGGDDAGSADLDGDGVAAPADCDDSDPDVHPGAAETCDLSDQDCDEAIDEGVTTDYFADADADGHGTGEPVAACARPAGHAELADDCDDTDPDRYPGNAESCDFYDEDCDDVIDEGALDAIVYYEDADGDGHGDPASTSASCSPTPPIGWSDLADDCAPADGTISPSGVEVCDGVDQDCDLVADEDASDAPTWYRDVDGDGWGTNATTMRSCSSLLGYVDRGGDCDDTPPAGFVVNPGITTDDPDPAGVDANCDGVDGDASTMVFVAPGTCGCVDSGATAGRATSPYCSLSLALAAAGGTRDVALSNGIHVLATTLSLPSGAELYGGYQCTSGWSRDTSSAATTVRANAGSRVTLRIDSPSADVVLSHLTIVGPDMSGVTSGESIAVLALGVAATNRIQISNSTLIGGVGGPGASGAAGGLEACDQPGGAGGASWDCSSSSGAQGANNDWDAAVRPGGWGGGAGASYCVLACAPYGTAGVGPGGRGTDGFRGADAGSGGARSGDTDGALSSAGDWLPRAGSPGSRGSHGSGGGGGGGGGWKSQSACGACAWDIPGGQGGAGGRGGCGGSGGTPGTQGGASIALVLVNARVTLTNVALERDRGGHGGAGGAGGNGATGLGGAAGGGRSSDGCGRESEAGGAGGRGGDGGGASGGAGGNGGPSLCVARAGSSAIDGIADVSLICTARAGATGGAGGAGGAGGRNGDTTSYAPVGENGAPGLSTAISTLELL